VRLKSNAKEFLASFSSCHLSNAVDRQQSKIHYFKKTEDFFWRKSPQSCSDYPALPSLSSPSTPYIAFAATAAANCSSNLTATHHLNTKNSNNRNSNNNVNLELISENNETHNDNDSKNESNNNDENNNENSNKNENVNADEIGSEPMSAQMLIEPTPPPNESVNPDEESEPIAIQPQAERHQHVLDQS
jgi:hypothetical protein